MVNKKTWEPWDLRSFTIDGRDWFRQPPGDAGWREGNEKNVDVWDRPIDYVPVYEQKRSAEMVTARGHNAPRRRDESIIAMIMKRWATTHLCSIAHSQFLNKSTPRGDLETTVFATLAEFLQHMDGKWWPANLIHSLLSVSGRDLRVFLARGIQNNFEMQKLYFYDPAVATRWIDGKRKANREHGGMIVVILVVDEHKKRVGLLLTRKVRNYPYHREMVDVPDFWMCPCSTPRDADERYMVWTAIGSCRKGSRLVMSDQMIKGSIVVNPADEDEGMAVVATAVTIDELAGLEKSREEESPLSDKYLCTTKSEMGVFALRFPLVDPETGTVIKVRLL